MKIACIDKDIRSVLGSGFYRIPRFQRPYLWEKDQVEEFWNDAVANPEPDCFIGSIVVFGPHNDTYGIVDGQQRLTTITMLLCALRNAFLAEKKEDLAKGIQGLVERPDISNKSRFVLQTETSYPYLQEKIQKLGDADDDGIEVGEEEERLQKAFDLLVSLVTGSINAIRTDTTIPAKDKVARIREKLVQIRDRILNLKLIFVGLDNEDDAYLIFETLNTRGKDLTVSDLVKNHLTRLIKPTNAGLDRTKDRWTKLTEIIEGSEEDLRVNSFLHHLWLSEYDYTTEKKLFKAIRSVVKKDNAAGFLKALLAEAETYREIHETSYKKWPKQQLAIKGSLDAFQIFRIKQHLPMVMAVIRDFKAGKLKQKHVEDILFAIESFHFMFTAVTSQRSSGGISFMYAAHARELLSAKDTKAKLASLTELKTKLRKRLPSFAEFEADFQEIAYTSSFTKQKRLVQYILARIDEANAIGVHLDYERMTIEHLGSQSGAGKGIGPAKNVGKIGNLILVDEATNNKLGNKDFASKLKILAGTNVFLDAEVKKASTWNDGDVLNRTKKLAKSCFDKIWRF